MEDVHPIKVLRAIRKSLRTNDDFFGFVAAELRSRWTRIEELFAAIPDVKSVGRPQTFCIWAQCTSTDESCADRFAHFGIVAEEGKTFGSSQDFARICVGADASSFDLVMRRLAPMATGKAGHAIDAWKCPACGDHWIK